MSDGWIKLQREILDNPIVCKDAEYFSVWCYLLLNATHKEMDTEFKCERITLKPGQLVTGRKKIAEHFNINESKVQRILKKLEIEQQIEQITSTKNRLITIVNWDKYQKSEQQSEQQMNNNCTTNERQVNTNKNEIMEEGKKERKNYMDLSFIDNCITKVKITQKEYDELLSKYPEQLVHDKIEALEIYKDFKKYKEHYKVLSIWCKKDADNPKYKPKTVIDMSIYQPKEPPAWVKDWS